MVSGIIKSNQFFCIYFSCLAVYTCLSFKIFEKVNQLPGLVVDEIFHVPQGKLYCQGNFSYYDEKITTPPGLYWLSSLVLRPFQLCSTYWLRLFNFVIGIINIELLRQLCTPNAPHHESTKLYHQLISMMSAFTISLLPPMYFFNNFYYTDTLSTWSVLCMFVAAKYNCHFTSIFFGILSVVIRQTNIIWMCVVYGEYLITILLQALLTPYRTERITQTRFWIIPDVNNAIIHLAFHRFPFHLIRIYEYVTCAMYIGLIHVFLAFVYYNGGIVLGDKSAHTVTVHLPQLLYFGLFSIIFSFPHLLIELKSFLSYVRTRLGNFIFVYSIAALTVALNTQIHAYLLADNRHYTFYIWNRFLSKAFYRYSAIVVYLFALFAMFKRLIAFTSFPYIFVYVVGTFLATAFQKLIDVRYFILPYIALRTRINVNNVYIIGTELFISLIINAMTFYVYFNKEFYWKDFEYPQRIIW